MTPVDTSRVATELEVEVNAINAERKAEEEAKKKYSAAFWGAIERGLNVIIPAYVKTIFNYQSLDNPLAIVILDADSIKSIEEFCRGSIYSSVRPRQANKSDYYGMYAVPPKEFKSTIGDENLIKKMQTFVENKTDRFWKSILSPAIRSLKARSSASSTGTAPTHPQHV